MYHYDAVPYESLPFAETHPQRLAVLGKLLGIDVALPEQCRVLELGSAAGGNLIPMAWYQPDSQFVGIELEAEQVRTGQKLIAELGIGNVQLLQGDILKLGDELGQFDYIVAHGVYSWVPDFVSEALLKLCKERLQPNGIAYISYNTSPGWRVRGMVREILLYHVRDIADPVTRLNTALDYVRFLVESLPQPNQPLTQYLIIELKYLLTAHPSYVYHEFLEEYNRALLFSDFIAQAKRYGLRYLCESHLASMFASAYGPKVEKFLDGYADMLEHEQYLDFFTQRTFRQTLLCHAEIEPNYDIDLNMLDTFACHAQLKPPAKIEARVNKPQKFTNQNGKEYEVDDPVCKYMLQAMYETYPNAVVMSTVAEHARQRYQATQKSRSNGDDNAWRAEIFGLIANNAIHLRLTPHEIDMTIGDKPRVNALVYAQAREGHNLTTMHHETIYTDAFTQRLVACLDGTRNIEMLLAELVKEVIAGELVIPGMNIKSLSSDQLIKQMRSNIQRLLTLFSRNGLLVAETMFSEGRAA